MAMSQPIILVVEDDAAVRPVAAGILEDAGFRVLEAAGGDQAFRLLDQHPEIALIFTDIVMPGIDGFALAERARLKRPDLRVLYTTGDATAAPGVGIGVHGAMLPKPYRPGQLAAWVRLALA